MLEITQQILHLDEIIRWNDAEVEQRTTLLTCAELNAFEDWKKQ